MKDAKRLQKLAGKAGTQEDDDGFVMTTGKEGEEEEEEIMDMEDEGLASDEEFASYDEEINSDEC